MCERVGSYPHLVLPASMTILVVLTATAHARMVAAARELLPVVPAAKHRTAPLRTAPFLAKAPHGRSPPALRVRAWCIYSMPRWIIRSAAQPAGGVVGEKFAQGRCANAVFAASIWRAARGRKPDAAGSWISLGYHWNSWDDLVAGVFSSA